MLAFSCTFFAGDPYPDPAGYTGVPPFTCGTCVLSRMWRKPWGRRAVPRTCPAVFPISSHCALYSGHRGLVSDQPYGGNDFQGKMCHSHAFPGHLPVYRHGDYCPELDRAQCAASVLSDIHSYLKESGFWYM